MSRQLYQKTIEALNDQLGLVRAARTGIISDEDAKLQRLQDRFKPLVDGGFIDPRRLDVTSNEAAKNDLCDLEDRINDAIEALSRLV